MFDQIERDALRDYRLAMALEALEGSDPIPDEELINKLNGRIAELEAENAELRQAYEQQAKRALDFELQAHKLEKEVEELREIIPTKPKF